MDLDISLFFRSLTLLVVLLNPFLMSVYLLDLIERLDNEAFSSVLVRGAGVATLVFWGFAVGGDAIFSQLLQVRFASFLIFGGVLFVIIGLQFAQSGSEALTKLRGKPQHFAGSIAVPFMVGPATVSASVITGARLPLVWALAAIGSAILADRSRSSGAEVALRMGADAQLGAGRTIHRHRGASVGATHRNHCR